MFKTLRLWLSRDGASSPATLDRIPLREGEARLVIVQGSSVLQQTPDVSLSHAEFVQRTVGSLPDGAWVGTIRKSAGSIVAMNSRTFYGNQLPGPRPVLDVIATNFY